MERKIKKGILGLIVVIIICLINNVSYSALNNNPMLKAIKINGEDINPEFEMFTTEYVVTVGENIENVTVEGIPDDSNAKVEVVGEKKLKEGRNVFEIRVTAEDRNSRRNIFCLYN